MKCSSTTAAHRIQPMPPPPPVVRVALRPRLATQCLCSCIVNIGGPTSRRGGCQRASSKESIRSPEQLDHSLFPWGRSDMREFRTRADYDFADYRLRRQLCKSMQGHAATYPTGTGLCRWCLDSLFLPAFFVCFYTFIFGIEVFYPIICARPSIGQLLVSLAVGFRSIPLAAVRYESGYCGKPARWARDMHVSFLGTLHSTWRARG